jgi:hypothetical protein
MSALGMSYEMIINLYNTLVNIIKIEHEEREKITPKVKKHGR